MNIKKTALLLLAGFLAYGIGTCSELAGRYCGKLDVFGSTINLRLNFSESDDPVYPRCSMDSPDQGAFGIESRLTLYENDSIIVEIDKIGARFTGRCIDDTLKGFFIQQGYKFPIILIKSASDNRPQTPRPPYPYTTIDTIFINKESGLKLGATITIPERSHTERQSPAVVFISGSGLQNRDEEIFGHRPFAVLADALARNGIASLRFDDRGIGESESDGRIATTYDFKSDTEAALNFIRGIDGMSTIGIIGHSEGGTIAVMCGAEGKADFIISMAGALAPMKETMLKQNRDALSRSGIDNDTRQKIISLLDTVFTEISRLTKEGISDPEIDVKSIAEEKGINLPTQLIDQLSSAVTTQNPWINTSLTIDPALWLKRLNCPAMFINGTNDIQVDANANLSIALRYRPFAIIKSYESLNHLFQHSATGLPSEYSEIEETISPDVISDIVNFIKLMGH